MSYFFCLALTDLLFNLTLLGHCISNLMRSYGETLCRLFSFLSHLTELLSACFTAQFTAQRFIAVRFPLSVFIEKKIHLLHYVIVSILVMFGLIYCLALVHASAYDHCYEELEFHWFISDAILSFALPFTIIAILNLLIVIHLQRSFQHHRHFRFSQRHRSEPGSIHLPHTNRSFCEMHSFVQCRANIFDNDSSGHTRVRHRLVSNVSISSTIQCTTKPR
jgi:hypothetical protein